MRMMPQAAMINVTHQLEQVRRMGRALLIAGRLLQATAVLALAALLAAGLDWALRPPGWLRLVLLLMGLTIGLTWLVVRLWRAAGFAPSLALLALRAERRMPHLAGLLTSGVEFSTAPDRYRASALEFALAAATVRQAERQIGDRTMMELLNPSHAVRWGVLALLGVVVVASIFAVQPTTAQLALARWLMPLGSAQWPNRTQVVGVGAPHHVWPTDTPMPVVAAVERGYHPSLRTMVRYRLVMEDGTITSWDSLLMNEQARRGDRVSPHDGPHRYEQLIDVPGLLHQGRHRPVAVEYRFEAGDHLAAVQRVRLAARPAVVQVSAAITPPAYAAGLVEAMRVDLAQTSAAGGLLAAASALAGSQVALDIRFNKALPEDQLTLAQLLPGFDPGMDASIEAVGDADVTVRFVLRQTAQSTIQLRDENGLTNQSERTYRLEALEDHAPAVAVTQPAADESVLPTARIMLEAVAQDDIAVASVEVEAAHSGAEGAQIVAAGKGRSARLAAGGEVAFGPWNLKPGDEVTLTAVTRDIFDLDGRQHDPVRSSPRRLRVIDPAAMVSQLRAELAALRQQAIRLAAQQRDLTQQAPASAATGQDKLTDRLQGQQQTAQRLGQRARRNGLQEPAVTALIDRAEQLLEAASQSSQEAGRNLAKAGAKPSGTDDAVSQGRQQQQQVQRRLEDLIAQLDQGQDILTLELQMRQLLQQQEQLAGSSQELMPRTAGQAPQSLPPGDREALENLSKRQEALAQRSAEMLQQMRQAAEAMSQPQRGPEDQAGAAALSEAAGMAQQQGLTPTMKQAAQSASANRLADASSQQGRSADILRQMLQQVQQREQKQYLVLRRRLVELEEAIALLIKRQEGEIAMLGPEKDLPPLAEPQGQLRRNTMVVSEQAGAMRQTAAAQISLNQAVQQQGQAIEELRGRSLAGAQEAQGKALSHLKTALDQVKQVRQAADEEQARQQRLELANRYEALAEQQDKLREQTQEMFPQPGQPLDRQRIRALIDLGNQQADVQVAANELGRHPDVVQTLVFRHLHVRLDKLTGEVVTGLRQAKADTQSTARQTEASALLRTMAGSLASQPTSEPFASGESGDSGGGGGGGGPPPLVPPIAELRLLRGMQESVYEQTRVAAGALETQTAHLVDLSARQRELAQLGDELIRRFMQAQQGALTKPVIHDVAPPEENP